MTFSNTGDGVRRRRFDLEAQSRMSTARDQDSDRRHSSRARGYLRGSPRSARAEGRSGSSARDRPPGRESPQHSRQHEGRRQAHRLWNRKGAVPHGGATPIRASSKARSHTWPRSKPSARRWTAARTSGPSAPSSTICWLAVRPTKATISSRRSTASRRVARPAPLPSTVHPAIAAIVNRALTYAPDGRFSTAADMRDEIERGMVTAGVETRPSQVAAFGALHLGDRAEKRRIAIDEALAIATERKRLEGYASNRRGASLSNWHRTATPRCRLRPPRPSTCRRTPRCRTPRRPSFRPSRSSRG